MSKKIFDYETLKLTSRRTKVVRLWSSEGKAVATYKKTKAGKVSFAGYSRIASHAWAVPVHLEFVEAIVIDGVPAYTADESSESRPSTYPLGVGGRFRFVRTLCDGETVQRTLYLSDVPDAEDVRVVFGWRKPFTGGKDDGSQDE